MKISASIYSAKDKKLSNLVQELDELNIDSFHIDCFQDELSKVTNDVKSIKSISKTAIDFHAITENVAPFFEFAISENVEQLTFQFENLKRSFTRPKEFKGQLGISIVSDTDSNVLKEIVDQVDFILLMTTKPGVSGGKFERESFSKIAELRRLYPKCSIHVDGGINAEVSFILRLLGVDSAVSGSFLVNHSNIAFALSELRFHQIASQFHVSDYMTVAEELPIINIVEGKIKESIKLMDDANLGFVFFQQNNKLAGVCSNADLRKGIIKKLADLNQLDIYDILNRTPLTIQEDATTSEMIDLVKHASFPVLFLPVVNQQNEIRGAVLFNQLIRGEG